VIENILRTMAYTGPSNFHGFIGLLPASPIHGHMAAYEQHELQRHVRMKARVSPTSVRDTARYFVAIQKVCDACAGAPVQQLMWRGAQSVCETAMNTDIAEASAKLVELKIGDKP